MSEDFPSDKNQEPSKTGPPTADTDGGHIDYGHLGPGPTTYPDFIAGRIPDSGRTRDQASKDWGIGTLSGDVESESSDEEDGEDWRERLTKGIGEGAKVGQVPPTSGHNHGKNDTESSARKQTDDKEKAEKEKLRTALIDKITPFIWYIAGKYDKSLAPGLKRTLEASADTMQADDDAIDANRDKARAKFDPWLLSRASDKAERRRANYDFHTQLGRTAFSLIAEGKTSDSLAQPSDHGHDGDMKRREKKTATRQAKKTAKVMEHVDAIVEPVATHERLEQSVYDSARRKLIKEGELEKLPNKFFNVPARIAEAGEEIKRAEIFATDTERKLDSRLVTGKEYVHEVARSELRSGRSAEEVEAEVSEALGELELEYQRKLGEAKAKLDKEKSKWQEYASKIEDDSIDSDEHEAEIADIEERNHQRILEEAARNKTRKTMTKHQKKTARKAKRRTSGAIGKRHRRKIQKATTKGLKAGHRRKAVKRADEKRDEIRDKNVKRSQARSRREDHRSDRQKVRDYRRYDRMGARRSPYDRQDITAPPVSNEDYEYDELWKEAHREKTRRDRLATYKRASDDDDEVSDLWKKYARKS